MRNLKQFLFSERKVIRVKRDRIKSLLFQSPDSTSQCTLKACREPLQHKFSPLVPLLFKLLLSALLLCLKHFQIFTPCLLVNHGSLLFKDHLFVSFNLSLNLQVVLIELRRFLL